MIKWLTKLFKWFDGQLQGNDVPKYLAGKKKTDLQ